MRSAAPIIIHINLDKVLKFLVEDSHYRNQFETGTSGGSTDLAARTSWEVSVEINPLPLGEVFSCIPYIAIGMCGTKGSVLDLLLSAWMVFEHFGVFCLLPLKRNCNSNCVVFVENKSPYMCLIVLSLQDRIFNNSYKHSSPSERVKYGVLNIGKHCSFIYNSTQRNITIASRNHFLIFLKLKGVSTDRYLEAWCRRR